MKIEEEIFKKSIINYNKLLKYGFKKIKDEYIYEKNFLNDSFKAIIIVTDTVKGKVVDLETNEEYTNIRTKMNGEFVNKVRDEYKKILLDIQKNCFETSDFIFDQTARMNSYIEKKYDCKIENLWEKYPGYGIYRNKKTNKWFGIIMNVDKSKLTNKDGEVEIIDLKVNKDKIPDLITKKGYYEAYHMNKKSWITIILDDTLDDTEITKLIDESYDLVK